jgi:hypothetical protein
MAKAKNPDVQTIEINSRNIALAIGYQFAATKLTTTDLALTRQQAIEAFGLNEVESAVFDSQFNALNVSRYDTPKLVEPNYTQADIDAAKAEIVTPPLDSLADKAIDDVPKSPKTPKRDELADFAAKSKSA